MASRSTPASTSIYSAANPARPSGCLRGVSDATLVQSLVNVVNDHSSDRFAAMGLRQQIARQSGSSYVRDVLVLANRCDFILIETAKAEAVFQ
jgi:hypothetical protein